MKYRGGIPHGSDDIAHIIISLCGTKDSEKLLKKPAQIICLDKQGGNSPRFIWDLAKVIRSALPDVVHTRNWIGMDGILTARLMQGFDLFVLPSFNIPRRNSPFIAAGLVGDGPASSRTLLNAPDNFFLPIGLRPF